MPGKFTGGTAQEQPRQEGHDCGQDAENYRLGHQHCAGNGSFDATNIVVRLGMNAFAYHDGVIDNDAQHQQESEGGQHIKRHANRGQENKGSRVGSCNTCCDPKRDDRAQRQDQENQNQRQANGGRAADGFHAALEFIGVIGPQGQFGAFGQRILALLDPFPDGIRGLDDIHGLGGHDLQQNRGFTIESGKDRVVFEAIYNRGYITHADDPTIAGLPDDDVREFSLGVCLAAYFELIGSHLGTH